MANAAKSADPKVEDKVFREFGGVNTQASRISIKDEEFAWLENVMPISDANARAVPGPTTVQTLAGQVISSAFGVNINGIDYNICFTAAGAGYQVLAASPYTSVQFAAPGTFSASGVTAAQWKNERVLILDPVNGYFDWDTVKLTSYSSNFTWTIRTSAADNTWSSVTWSPDLNLFVAVSVDGTGNRVMTSPDGVNWTIRVSAADNNWTSVTWAPALNLFVAVAGTGTGNRVMTSPDGVNWTIRVSAADNNWYSVTWSPGLNLFVAVATTGIGNRVMTSPNGITWTIRTSAADNNWTSVTWAPALNLFVAVASTGTGNRVMTSPDGITWASRASAADNAWQSVTWAPALTLFVAVAATGTGNRVMTSPDGVTWTIRTSAADNSWQAITWSPSLSLFFAVSGTGTGNRAMTSPDGIAWTIRTSAADNNWTSVTWSPSLNLFVAVAGSGTGNRVMTLLRFNATGTDIATFAGRVWIAKGRVLQFSDVNSYQNFGGAGGSLIITDSLLRSDITRIINANNFLYIFGSNCVYVIGDVRVSSGITLYTLTNLTASVGTDLPKSVISYGRELLFQTRYGMYSQKGAIPVKMSDDIDGTVDLIDYTKTISAGQVIIYKQLCAVFSFTYLDPAGARSLLAVYFRNRWFFSSQGALTLIWGTIVNGKQALFGTDGAGVIYQLFTDTVSNISTKISTKLWDMGDPIANKQVTKLGVSLSLSTGLQPTTLSVDTEKNSSTSSLAPDNTITWVNNAGQIIVFTNGASQPLSWINLGYIFFQSDSGIYAGGKYVGLTLVTTTPQYTLYALILEFIKRARWGQ